MKIATVRIPLPMADEIKKEAKWERRSFNAHVLALIEIGRVKRKRSNRAPSAPYAS